MPRYIRPLGTTHHRSDHHDCAPPIFALRPGQDPEYAALLAVWEAGGTCPDEPTEDIVPPTPEQFQQLKREGLLAVARVVLAPTPREPLPAAYQPTEASPDVRIVLWY